MKDWTGTSASAFKQLGASNHANDEREENDYYATDPTAIDDLVRVETLDTRIWEPACGEGHLAKRLTELGYDVTATDLIDRGYGEGGVDFLEIKDWNPNPPYFPGDIITNPPYKYCTDFILKSLELVKEGHKVCMFLKLQTLEGQERYNRIYKDNPPKTIYVYSKRKQCGKNGNFTGSSAVCYAWFVWEKGFKGDTTVKWI